ncbi:MAG: hypothetical protein ACFFAO_15775, partial [Candidatus Hermodarchaeota archaeon]
RILLDTNIIIGREDNKILNEDLQILLRILSKLNITLIVHPKSIEDIERDTNQERKKITLSKFKTYEILTDFPNYSEDSHFIGIIGEPKKVNDQIDYSLLYSVFRNAVNFLLTEDLDLLKKSIKLGIDDRILTISDARSLFEKELPKKIRLPPAIKKTTMAQLDLKDPIFDTLREDYKEFDEWFINKARKGRECWIYQRNNGTLGAVLIYKIEDESIPSIPPLSRVNRLKIATMKVSYLGYKIGELLLKLAIELAIKNNLTEIYLTHFTKESDYLVNLIEEYGFKKIGIIKGSNGEEDLFLKKIFLKEEDLGTHSPIEISKNFYPNLYDGIEVKKHIVPIQPVYHDRLFTDFPKRQSKINEYAGRFIIEGNTIKKAYLCHASSQKMNQGDIIIFYRSKDLQSLVSLGIIEKIYYDKQDQNEVASIVGKRTVYSLSEISELVKKPTTVILFNHHFHFRRFIPLKELKSKKIIKGAPQSIMEIDHDIYLNIKKRGGIDKRFTFH